MTKEVLGVDIGGVIISRSIIEESYLPLADAFAVLKRLKEERFGDNIVFISHASTALEGHMRTWLLQRRIYDLTGISEDQIHFCRDRNKEPLCREYKVTHFIDDRTENLARLLSIVKHLYLFQGRFEEMEPRLYMMDRVIQVSSWLDFATKLLS